MDGSAPVLAELTREELRALGPECVVVIPLGATEQHGPHLPLGTDTLHVEHVARAAVARVHGQAPIVLAPALAYGCSPHHVPLGATLSLSSATLRSVLVDLGGSLATAGVRRVFFVNGHGGNVELVQIAARDIMLAHHVLVGACTWWTLVEDAQMRVPGHAGAFETAVVRALRPDLIRAAVVPRRPDAGGRAPDSRVRVERPGALQALDGYTDDPASGLTADGAAHLDAAVAALADALIAFATT
jgi:creatinine amidohydrolase